MPETLNTDFCTSEIVKDYIADIGFVPQFPNMDTNNHPTFLKEVDGFVFMLWASIFTGTNPRHVYTIANHGPDASDGHCDDHYASFTGIEECEESKFKSNIASFIDIELTRCRYQEPQDFDY